MWYQPNIHSSIAPQFTAQLQIELNLIILNYILDVIDTFRIQDECINISEQQVIKW